MNMRPYAVPLLAALALTLSCASVKIWQRWPADEQKRYFGLSCVASDSELAAYCALPEPESRNEWYRAYWSRDHDGVSIGEHRRRTDYAWQEFGAERCYRDARGRIYVQYGEPTDHWRSTVTWRYLNSAQLAGGSMMRERPWEVWQYPQEGLYFDLIEFNEAYRIWATVRLDRRHPIAFFDTSRCPAAPPPRSAGESKAYHPLESQWARFRSPSIPGKVRWEFYWRVPVAAVRDGPVAVAFALTDAAGKQTADTIQYRVVIPADSLQEPYAFGQRNLDLNPGHYRMEITVLTSGGAVYRSKAEAELVAYRPGVQECSDVELALLQDTTMSSRDFQKGKYTRVIPYVTDVLPTRQPYFIYFEVYNLTTDGKGDHHIVVRLHVFQAGRDTLAERPFATGEFNYDEPGEEFHGCHCVYPRDLGAGELYLLVSVEDQLNGRMTKLIRKFRLKE